MSLSLRNCLLALHRGLLSSCSYIMSVLVPGRRGFCGDLKSSPKVPELRMRFAGLEVKDWGVCDPPDARL